jgi:hypothetical protein
MGGTGQRRTAALPPPAAEQWAWTLVCLFLLVVAVGTAWPLLLRSGANLQFDYNEGWNAYRAQAAAHFLPLFSAPPGLDITDYPPLSFHLIGLLGRLHLDVVLLGRFLSVLSLLAVCLVIRQLARHCVSCPRAADAAALLFFLWLEMWMPNRVAVDDPQLLGMAFEMAGFACAFRWSRSSGAMAGSAALYAVAVFTKHNLVALPLATAAGLLAGRDWRRLFWWVAAGVLATAVLFALTRALDGPYFLSHLLRERSYSLADAIRQTLSYVSRFLPILAVIGTWVWRNRFSSRKRPLVLGWIFAHATAVLFSGGDGTAGNMFFEALVCDAVIFPLALSDYLACHRVWRAPVVSLVIALPVLVSLAFLPATTAASFREWRNLPRAEADFAEGVTLLRNTGRPVLCENLLMCYRAGKTSAFNPFFVLDQIKTGTFSARTFVDMLENRQLAAVEIGDTDVAEPPGRVRFPASFKRALAACYRVALRTPEFFVAVPAAGEPEECRRDHSR